MRNEKTMQNQGKMMDLVWLLNAAAGSAFETKGLYLEFLRRQEDFKEIRKNLSAGGLQYDYLEQEIRQNLENIESLRESIQEVIKILIRS
ncbi:MAG: hypothetical protein LBB91_09495 [Clostridiales bacterium]|nr:hypothetical protein [Clostridiales bacterium]